MSNKILIVSAGMEKPKKRDNLLARRQLFLNYGALTLATILDNKGYSVKLLHGLHDSPSEFVEKLISEGRLTTGYPLLLSIPSYYALSWAQEFCVNVRKYSQSLEIIVGGRWVIGSDIDWLKKKLPLVNNIVPGLVENYIEQIVEGRHRGILTRDTSSPVPVFNLNHHLIQGFKRFQPSIEASRGCGMGCAFCEERDIPLTPLKNPELLVSHFNQITEQYQDTNIRAYLQSSLFIPSTKWAEEMATAVKLGNMNIFWRCQTRVDSMNPNTIAALAQAGLRVIDLGMETASERQILNMRKSQKPEKYLRAASDLLHACKKNGVWVKINFLIYAGETEETYWETIRWLDEHASAIKGVSVGPVVVFGSPKTSSTFIDDVLAAGATLVDETSSDRTGISHIHPSTEMSAKDAEDLSLKASQRYMSKKDYFDLKSFTYYPRNYSFEDFNIDVQSSKSILPFSLD